MPVKKGGEAYYALLQRKRMNYEINKLKKEQAIVGEESKRGQKIQNEINRIESQKKQTYQFEKQGNTYKRVRSKEDVAKKVAEFNEEFMPSKMQREIKKKNIQFAREIKLPFNKATKDLSNKYSEGEVRIFFAATKRAWEKGAPKDRLKNIMEAYNIKDLGKFFDDVIKANKEAVERYNEMKRKYSKAEVSDSEDQYQNASYGDAEDAATYDNNYMTSVVEISIPE